MHSDSLISLRVSTRKSTAEMKDYVISQLHENTVMSAAFTRIEWSEHVMEASGPLGSGTLTLLEGEAIVEIELSTMGRSAKSLISQRLQQMLEGG